MAVFVDDDEIVGRHVLGQSSAAAGGLLLLELINHIEEVDGPAPNLGEDDRRGEADAQVGLCRCRL